MWRLKNTEGPFNQGDCVYFDDDGFVYGSDLKKAKGGVGFIGFCDKNSETFYWTGVVDSNVDSKDSDDDVVLVKMCDPEGKVVIRSWVWVDKIKHIRAE